MKSRYALALAGLLAFPAAYAESQPQRPGPGMPPPETMIERIDERADLDLTEDQKQQIKTLMEEQRARHEAIRKETQERMGKILTPEQKKKLDEHHAKMMDRRTEQLERREERVEKRQEKVEQRKEKIKERKGEKTAE